MKCNFNGEKKLRPQLIPQLWQVVSDSCAVVASPALVSLKTDIKILQAHFATLESGSAAHTRSATGFTLLLKIVKSCQHLLSLQLLQPMLENSSAIGAGSKSWILAAMTKLGRYVAVARFLTEAARRYSIFRHIEISIVKLGATARLVVEPDNFTSSIIDNLCSGARCKEVFSKMRARSASDIKSFLSHNASFARPVHAEVQLLFYYESTSSQMPPRVICSSKKACYLCNLFFKIHGRFTVPSSHGRLYEKWALPNAADAEVRDRIANCTKMFILSIEGNLTQAIRSVRTPYLHPLDSAVFSSAACSQSSHSKVSTHRSRQSSTTTIKPLCAKQK